MVDTAGLPFGAVFFGPGAFNSIPYTHSGTCYEGTMSLCKGTPGTTLTWSGSSQGNGV